MENKLFKEKTIIKHEWEGWSLSENDYGGEFDLEARERMILGGKLLLAYLTPHLPNMGEVLLDIGPFFNPLFTPTQFPEKKICYWENDVNALANLAKLSKESIFPLNRDLNEVLLPSFHEKHVAFCEANDFPIELFTSVLVSQVMNYIDYSAVLKYLLQVMKPGGLLFINNVVDHGIPQLFSDKRPTSIPETIKAIEAAGFSVILQEELPTDDIIHQPEPRLIVVAQK